MEKGKAIVSIDFGGRYTLHLKPLPEGTEVLKEEDFIETFIKKYGENVDIGEEFYGEVSEETLKKLMTVYIQTAEGYKLISAEKFGVTYIPGKGVENHVYTLKESGWFFEDFEIVTEAEFLKRIGKGEKVALATDFSREGIYHMACMGYYDKVN